jgi:excisionase family DNA binding protein
MATTSTEDHDHHYAGLWSARKAADYLGLSVKTVWKLCREDRLPHTRLHGSKHLLIPVSAVRAYERAALQQADGGDQ